MTILRALSFSLLLLTPVFLLSQNRVMKRPRQAEPAIEFTTTSNASQTGVNFVMGYQFTVLAPVTLTSLGAVLKGNGFAQPIFGGLPASMAVGVWDESRNLLISATVSNEDPLTGHFNYTEVAETLLMPGVNYTIAGLAPRGSSVLSDVPAMQPGSLIVYGGPRSLASGQLAYPAGDQTGLRNNYLGPGFRYTGGSAPVAIPGPDRQARPGETVKLDGSKSFSAAGGSVGWKWALISAPPGSTAALSEADSASPAFHPDRVGIYVAQLIVDDGLTHSRPMTVSIDVAESR